MVVVGLFPFTAFTDPLSNQNLAVTCGCDLGVKASHIPLTDRAFLYPTHSLTECVESSHMDFSLPLPL